MAEVAAHLTDHVIPPVPARQWVLSLPKRLRPYLTHDPVLVGRILVVLFARDTDGSLVVHRARGLDADAARALTPLVKDRVLRLLVRRRLLNRCA